MCAWQAGGFGKQHQAGKGFGESNLKGEMILELADALNLAVANTF